MTAVWNPADPDELVRRYGSGDSVHKLAREFGVSGKTIQNALRRLGVEVAIRTQPLSAEIIAAYAGGESVLSLSRRTGISRTSLTERLRVSGVALRGVENNGRNSLRSRSRSALTKELRQSMGTPVEAALVEQLAALGLDPVPQRAVGPYNVDIAVLPVAVEVLGSDWHNDPGKLRHLRKRTEHILDAGWNVIYVIARSTPGSKVAHQIAAFVEQSRREPSFQGQYRVIGSNGRPSAAFSFEFD